MTRWLLVPRATAGLAVLMSALVATSSALRLLVGPVVGPGVVPVFTVLGVAAAAVGIVIGARDRDIRIIVIAIAAASALLLPFLSSTGPSVVVEPVRLLTPVALAVACSPRVFAGSRLNGPLSRVVLGLAALWLVLLVIPAPLGVFVTVDVAAQWAVFVLISLPCLSAGAKYVAGASRGDGIA